MAFDSEPAARQAPLATLWKTKLPLWVFLILVVLLIAVLASRQLAVKKTEQQVESERQELASKFEAERTALVARAQENLTSHSDDAHLLFGQALAWAVRSALIRNNLDEIDQYFAALVKNQRVELALVANQEGKVVVSSDRQFQGTDFSQHFSPDLLEADKVTLHRDGKRNRLILPIQGLTSRLGTALVTYTAP